MQPEDLTRSVECGAVVYSRRTRDGACKHKQRKAEENAASNFGDKRHLGSVEDYDRDGTDYKSTRVVFVKLQSSC